jgi:putative NADH-flavin reductase
MARIAIFGGTGFAGRHIAAEAVQRGHEVWSITRKAPTDPVPGVDHRTGSLLDADDRARALEGADVVVVATAPREDMAQPMRGAVADLAAQADRAGVRVGVVGGAGSSLLSEGGPKLADGLDLPAEWMAEIWAMSEILDDLRAGPATLDWFLVCPPRDFGVSGGDESVERLGHYRTGGDVLVVAEDDSSMISGPDFALAFVDEIENGAFRRARFTVGY